MPNVHQVTVSKVTGPNMVKWQVTFAEIAEVPLFTAVKSTLWCGGAPYTPTVTYSQHFAAAAATGNGGYAWQYVPATGGAGAGVGGSYLLTNLLPGATYYTRVSPVTALGPGQRRLTAPAMLAAPVTPPSAPTQREGAWGPPKLFLASPTSLSVRVGPPTFDGGALAGTYRVEWDTVSTFNSGPSGQALGGASVPAYTTVCDACVSKISFLYNTASPVVTVDYTGSADTVRQLQTGARVVIVTTDDHLPYSFVVADASASTTSFRLASPGLREYTFAAASASANASVYLMGADYEITGLTPGLNYFARVKVTDRTTPSTHHTPLTTPYFAPA